MRGNTDKIRNLIVIGGAVIFIIVLLILPTRARAAATLSLNPAGGSHKVGDEISASVYLNTSGQAANAAEGTVNFSADYLEYQSISINGSIFTFWTSNPSGNSTSVSFSGGLANPGYNGDAGKILTITWRAKAAGTASVSISGGKVLANDGIGTNIFGSSTAASFDIKDAAATISLSSGSHPEQNRWHNSKDVLFSWIGNSTINGYAFDFNRSAETRPATDQIVILTLKKYENVVDGVWYFHLIGRTAIGFSAVYHYKVQIDTVAPKDFSISVNQEGGLTNPQPKVAFEAEDELSGIDKYTARIDGGEIFDIKSGDALPKQRGGQHVVIVTAYDRAGNTRESQATFQIVSIDPPRIKIEKSVFSLMEPVSLIGNSDQGDTIVVFLDGQEVERFKAEEKKVTDKDWLKKHAFSEDSNKVTWEYKYARLLLPGEHVFRFVRQNKNGAESEFSEEIRIKILSATINIGNRAIPINYILITLTILLLIAALIIVFLLRKMRHLAVYSGKKAVSAALWMKRMAQFRRRVMNDIVKDLPILPLSEDETKHLVKKLESDIVKEDLGIDLDDSDEQNIEG